MSTLKPQPAQQYIHWFMWGVGDMYHFDFIVFTTITGFIDMLKYLIKQNACLMKTVAFTVKEIPLK